MKEERKPMCCNCKFATKPFKVHKMTYVHCEDPTKYTQEKFDLGEFTPWDTLREFGETCENHKFKQSGTKKG